MPFIITSKTRAIGNRGPKGQFSLNKDSPQAQNLVGWFPLMNGIYRNMALNAGAQLDTFEGTGSDTWQYDADFGNQAYGQNANSDRIYQTAGVMPGWVAGMTNYSVQCWAKSSVHAANNFIFELKDSSAERACYLSTSSTTEMVFSGRLNTVASTGGSGVGDSMFITGGRREKSGFDDIFIRINGHAESTAATAAAAVAGDELYIGGRSGSAIWGWEGQFADLRFYANVAFGDAQHNAFKDPQTRWDLFWQPSRTYFIPAAAGGGSITPTGLVSAEAFGTASIGGQINFLSNAIASAEAFGTQSVGGHVEVLTGIVSLETVTNPLLGGTVDFDGLGISTDENVSNANAIGGGIDGTGIASGEAIGSHQLNAIISVTAISSAEAIGSHTLAEPAADTIVPGAIASLEAFGTHALGGELQLTGIASAEAFGTTVLVGTISPSAIASLETFGTLVLDGTDTITASAIASLEAFGTAQLDYTITFTGIAGAEAFGTHTISLVVAGTAEGLEFTLRTHRLHYTMRANRLNYTMRSN